MIGSAKTNSTVRPERALASILFNKVIFSFLSTDGDGLDTGIWQEVG